MAQGDLSSHGWTLFVVSWEKEGQPELIFQNQPNENLGLSCCMFDMVCFSSSFSKLLPNLALSDFFSKFSRQNLSQNIKYMRWGTNSLFCFSPPPTPQFPFPFSFYLIAQQDDTKRNSTFQALHLIWRVCSHFFLPLFFSPFSSFFLHVL